MILNRTRKEARKVQPQEIIVEEEKNEIILPLHTTLRDDRKVIIEKFVAKTDLETGLNLFNLSVVEGDTWVYEDPLSKDEFVLFFLNRAQTFVLRSLEEGYDNEGKISKKGTILGIFFIKSRSIGRNDHFCTGGLVTHPDFRRKGIGRLMLAAFLRFAKDLQYVAALLDPVFETNIAATSLFESLGFQQASHVPSYFRLSPPVLQQKMDTEFCAGIFYYFDIENELPDDFDPLTCAIQRDSLFIDLFR